MQLFSYQETPPQLNETNFIAPGAIVIGEVELGPHASVWFNSVVRGDVNKIIIGTSTNIQDLSMLHVTAQHPLVVGNNVTVGHSVVLHGCTIEDGCLIGMGAKILDGAVIGKNSLVAAGSVVPPGKVYPPGSMIIGSPAKVKRPLNDQEVDQFSNHYKSYVEYAKTFMSSAFKKI